MTTRYYDGEYELVFWCNDDGWIEWELRLRQTRQLLDKGLGQTWRHVAEDARYWLEAWKRYKREWLLLD